MDTEAYGLTPADAQDPQADPEGDVWTVWTVETVRRRYVLRAVSEEEALERATHALVVGCPVHGDDQVKVEDIMSVECRLDGIQHYSPDNSTYENRLVWQEDDECDELREEA